MTTIITKNGSGAPTAGQLSEGELAVDLTNKELYTKSGSTVIKIGAQGGSTGTFTDLTATSSFTSPGIDDNANATAITIDASENVGIGTAVPSVALDVTGSIQATVSYRAYDSDTSAYRNVLRYDAGDVRLETGTAGAASIGLWTASQERMTIDASGDVTIGSASTYLAAANRRVLQATGGTDGSAMSLQGTTGDFYIHSGSGNTANVNVVNRANGYMNFFTNNTERMRIDASGNLGIGGTTAGNAGSINVSVGEPGSTVGGLQLWAGTSGSHFLQFGDAASGDGYYRGAIGYLHASDALVAYSAGTERMRIDASGNVGIGRAAPAISGYKVLDCYDNLTGGIIQASNATGSLRLVKDATNGYVNNADTGSLIFQVSSTERMRIDASGNLLVGTTASGPVTTTDSGAMLGSAGNSEFYRASGAAISVGRGSNGTAIAFYVNGNNAAGGINITQGGTPAFAAASDIRLKDNVTEHESELANVMSLRPVRWDWKKDEQGSGEGFIAQELEDTAWSDLVSEGEDGFKMVSGLGTVETRLIKAMQEQQAMIETLQAEVAALKGE